MSKVNNKNTKTTSQNGKCCKIFKVCLTILWRRSGDFVNFKDIYTFLSVSVVDFEQVKVCWTGKSLWNNIYIDDIKDIALKFQLVAGSKNITMNT